MNYSVLLLLLFMCFNLTAMECCHGFLSDPDPISKKIKKILLIDAFIAGQRALINAHEQLCLNSCAPLNQSCTFEFALHYITKLLRQQKNKSRSYSTGQMLELNLLLNKNLSEDEDALLDLQKKRFEDFVSLEIPEKSDNLYTHIEEHSDDLLYDRLEEQLGGSTKNLTAQEIVKAIALLSNNRKNLLEALATKNHQTINNVTSQQLQLEPACIHHYVTNRCQKYQKQLSLTSQKFAH
jgi:hypothetical protein